MMRKHLISRLGALVLTLALCAGLLTVGASAKKLKYDEKLFDTSYVHTLDIQCGDWDSFIADCESKEYIEATLVIDGETFEDCALRAKGNTSMQLVQSSNSDRYSFKVEFDHYDKDQDYYGLDKLSLNNFIQDNSCMKDYLSYRLMNEFGVDAPLCSYIWITVNGEDWGLYLAVEGIEDSFVKRTTGDDEEIIYKPDTIAQNAKDDDEDEDDTADAAASAEAPAAPAAVPAFHAAASVETDTIAAETASTASASDEFTPPTSGEFTPPAMGGGPGGASGNAPGGEGGGTSGGTTLSYTDDDPDSYAAVFESAKNADIDKKDEKRLIKSLKKLSEGEDLDEVLDMDDVYRWFVVHNYVVNGDSYTGSLCHNYYLGEEDGMLRMIPWDYNLAFGGFDEDNPSGAVNDPIDSPLSISGDGSRPMVDWIFRDEEYTEEYHEYFAEFLDTVDVQGIIDEACALIDPYIEKDPTRFCTLDEFRDGVQMLRLFCQLRTESIRGQLDGTIPATDDGQSGSDALIDTTGLDLSVIGSFHAGSNGGGNGGGPGRNGGSFEPPAFNASGEASGETADSTETETAETADTAADGTVVPDPNPPV